MAGYVQRTLGADEEVLFRARFHWTYDFVSWCWLLLGASPFVLLFFLNRARPFDSWGDFWLAGAPGGFTLFLGFLLWLTRSIHEWTTEIVVTNYRFVYKRGWIARRTEEVSLEKIEEVNLRQSIWGRLLGYGELLVRGTGVGVFQLPPLAKPLQLRQTILGAKNGGRSGG